jgi:hypothetical protein
MQDRPLSTSVDIMQPYPIMRSSRSSKISDNVIASSVYHLLKTSLSHQIPDRCGRRPCIRGTRICVSDILEMLADNVSAYEILEKDNIQAYFLFLV